MRYGSILMLSLAVTFLLVNCDVNQSVSSQELSQALKEIVLSDEVIDLDALDDGGALSEEYNYGELAKTAGDTLPVDWRQVRFGRRINGKSTHEVTIELAETTAVALVTTTITGQFKVVLIDTTSGEVIDSVNKDFTEIAKQKLLLKRIRYTDRPKRDWRVVAASPVIGRSLGNTIEIREVRLQPRQSIGGLVLSNDTNDSLLNHLLDREQLVALKARGVYDVAVKLENSRPFYLEPGELVTFDFGMKAGVFKFRRPLLDENNDNVYEGLIGLHGKRSTMCRLVISVIDYATIFIKSAPMNSTFWALPYWVKS